MENFLHELTEVAKLPFDEISKEFKVIMLGNKLLHITNYLKILDYSKESISLKVKKNILNVIGSDLIISQINKREIIIKGEIYSFSLGDHNEKSEK